MTEGKDARRLPRPRSGAKRRPQGGARLTRKEILPPDRSQENTCRECNERRNEPLVVAGSRSPSHTSPDANVAHCKVREDGADHQSDPSRGMASEPTGRWSCDVRAVIICGSGALEQRAFPCYSRKRASLPNSRRSTRQVAPWTPTLAPARARGSVVALVESPRWSLAMSPLRARGAQSVAWSAERIPETCADTARGTDRRSRHLSVAWDHPRQ